MSRKPIALAMTGASGAAYGLRLLECLLRAGEPVYLMLSQPGQIVIGMETDLKLPARPKEIEEFLSRLYQAQPGQLRVFGRDQWTAPVASGSHAPRAMIVCPCTSGTLASIANGASKDLLERAADVVLKEQRKLILVLRETPLSAIHLENALKLARLGVTIMPACPGFYNLPQSVNDLVDFMVARVLDHLDIEHALIPRWGGETETYLA
ncbi:MAG: 3-octaprenyl-4-hydroxybenzoate carboxy-lyase UbiX [Gammaproteobacteria bacterium]|nr:MAG: 3-octaprenyl-4-hydroxybenzoate carboxy-lyase UbiX [Gammaproteobacteria bacterium]TND03999.1 MAG: 3-octaprenyl-4-hydroxybenzoate carboxy-lyase UbiX [Gammaproteobacteria bacterium]